MNVEKFNKLGPDDTFFFVIKGEIFNVGCTVKSEPWCLTPVDIERRVWLTREAALAAALKMANDKIMQSRKEILILRKELELAKALAKPGDIVG